MYSCNGMIVYIWLSIASYHVVSSSTWPEWDVQLPPPPPPPPSAAYMRQWIGSVLVQIMACRLFGAKPLPEPMLAYCSLGSWEQISMKFKSEFYHFPSRKCTWNCRLLKWRPFCPGGDELSGKTSYRQISRILKAVRWDVMLIGSLLNLTGNSAQRSCRVSKQFKF